MSDTATSIRLSEAQTDALAMIGKRDDRSRSWLIRRAIDEFIERHAGTENEPVATPVAT
jgi:predicted transcriptional regulator